MFMLRNSFMLKHYLNHPLGSEIVMELWLAYPAGKLVVV